MKIGGDTLSCTRNGQGIPLLCLHGGMGIDSGTLRVPGILELATLGCELVLFDQRGHGASSGATQYSHELWAKDVIQLSKQLGWQKFALLGHSYGGFIALEYAIRWPETLSHLILVSTSAGPVTFSPPACKTQDEVRSFIAERWPRFFVGEKKHWEIFDRLSFSPDPYNAAFAVELPSYNLRQKIGKIMAPTLLIVGAEDHYKSDMEWLAKELPDSYLHVFPNVGHFPFVEAKDIFLEVVSTFLRSK